MVLGSGERLVFGQWLVRKGVMEPAVLKSALNIQDMEKSDTLRTSPRLLGQILLDDFQVFKNRVELNKALVEFEQVKAAVSSRKVLMGTDHKISLPLTAVPGLQSSPTAGLTSGRGEASPHQGVPASPGNSGLAIQNRAIFGQFLVEKGKITLETLQKALIKQNEEATITLRASHRLLGEILMDDFNAFSSRIELNRLLIEFNEFKAQLDPQITD